MKVLPLSKGLDSLKPGQNLCLVYPNGKSHPIQIIRVKKLNRQYVFSIEGIDSREQAGKLRGAYLAVEASSITQSENEYFCDDIIGLNVIATDGRLIGKVVEIMETGSNDVYVVSHHDREVLIPAIREVIKMIDIASGKIIIEPMEGLLE